MGRLSETTGLLLPEMGDRSAGATPESWAGLV